MSSARRRGRARGNAGDENQQRRGSNPARGRVAPFDGPASRGSGSAAGSQSRASGPPSQAGTHPPSHAGTQVAQETARVPARDPAREGPAPRATDALKNIDMPASFYNIDGLVSSISVVNSFPSMPTKKLATVFAVGVNILSASFSAPGHPYLQQNVLQSFKNPRCFSSP